MTARLASARSSGIGSGGAAAADLGAAKAAAPYPASVARSGGVPGFGAGSSTAVETGRFAGADGLGLDAHARRLQLQHHQNQGIDIHALDGQRGAQIVGRDGAPAPAEGDQPVERAAIQTLRHAPSSPAATRWSIAKRARAGPVTRRRVRR